MTDPGTLSHHDEDELRRMSRVFMDAADPILIEDLDGIVVEMNDEAVRSYGWSRGELVGKPIKTIVPSDRHEQADDILARCKAGEVVRNIEGLRLCKNGTVVPVLLTLSLIRDETGAPEAVATIAKDIGAQKRAEESVRRMSKVFMDAADPILIEDLDGIVVEMNDEAVRIYGWSRDDLVGKPTKSIVAPERHAQADDIRGRCKAGEDVRNIEGLRQTRDGTVVPVLLTLSLIKDEDGRPDAVATMAKDISAQKHAEESVRRMSKVFMDAADPILIEDLDGVVVEMNDEAVRAYGWSRDDLVGKPIKTIVPADRHDQADDILERCKAGEDMRNIEGLRLTQDGGVMPVLLTLSLIRDEHGNADAVATIAKDISAQKRAEELLRKHRAHLEEEVAQRTVEMERKVKELELFNRISVDRELRMIEMKKEIDEVLVKAGEKPRYGYA